MVRQFSEQELEEFGAFLLYRYITEEKNNEKVKETKIGEIIRLALVDWLQKRGEFDDSIADDPPMPVLVQVH